MRSSSVSFSVVTASARPDAFTRGNQRKATALRGDDASACVEHVTVETDDGNKRSVERQIDRGLRHHTAGDRWSIGREASLGFPYGGKVLLLRVRARTRVVVPTSQHGLSGEDRRRRQQHQRPNTRGTRGSYR